MTGHADNDAQRGSEDRREGTSDSAHARVVILLVHDFRLPVVLEHIEAGRIVIVVPPDPQPPE